MSCYDDYWLEVILTWYSLHNHHFALWFGSVKYSSDRLLAQWQKHQFTIVTHFQGEFDWDEKTQGTILGAFFYGYIVTQLPGGLLAERMGGKRLFGFGCVGSALLTLLTPVAARAGIPYFLAVRVLQGVGEVRRQSVCTLT